MNEKVTVFILTYNRSKYLKYAIQSALNQSYTDYKVCVLDNCSTDDTEMVVKSFHDDRLHYIRHDVNIGSGGNINFAIDNCDTEFLVIFHDDDCMLPCFIEKEVDIMESQQEIVAVSCNAISIDENGNEGSRMLEETSKTFSYSNGELLEAFCKKGKYLIFPSIMYRTSFLREKKLHIKPEAGPCADVILYCDLERYGGGICELGECLMQSRHHSEQDSTINLNPMHMRLLEYMQEVPYYRQCLDKNISIKNSFGGRITKFIILDLINKKCDKKSAYGQLHHMQEILNLNKKIYLKYRGQIGFFATFISPIRWLYRLHKK